MNAAPPGIHRNAVLSTLATAAMLLGIALVAPVASASAAPTDGSISGTVTSGGGGAAGAVVGAYRYDPWEDEWERTRTDRVAEDGSYAITDLAPGTYRLRIKGNDRNGYVSEWYGDARRVWQATDVVVGEAEAIGGKDAEVARTNGITGVLTLPAGHRRADRWVQILDERGRTVRGVYARNDGTYRLFGLRAGTYRVAFGRLSGEALAAPEFYDDVAEEIGLAAATPVEVTDDGTTIGIDATLNEGGTLTGRVVDSEGVPAEFCQVVTYTDNGRLTGRSASTGDNGDFAVTGLTTGDYRLLVTGCGPTWRSYYDGDATLVSDRSQGEATVAVVLGSATALPADLVLPDGGPGDELGSISGTVTLPTGAVQKDRNVRLVRVFEGGGSYRYDSTHASNGDGSYSFHGVPSGTYRLEFGRVSGLATSAAQFYDGVAEVDGIGAADLVTVDPGSAVTGIDATLAEGGHLTGRVVTPSGEPLAGCRLSAYTPRGVLVQRTGLSAADGAFDIGGLSNGQYKLTVESRGSSCRITQQYYGGQTALVVRERLAEPVSASALGDLVVMPRASVSGTVSLPEGLTSDDVSWRDQTVTLYRAGTGEEFKRTQVGSDGTYAFDRLVPGSYRVSFARVSGAALAAEFYDDVPEGQGMAAGRVIDVGRGEKVTGIDATLGLGGTMTGVLHDPDGLPIRGCAVRAFTPDGSLLERTDTTDATGAFEIVGLSTGDYTVRAGSRTDRDCRGGGTQFVQDGGGAMTGVRSQADPVAVAVGQVVALTPELVYGAGAAITGDITLPEGRNQWVTVDVVDTDTGDVIVSRQYRESRPYSIIGLAPGSYRVDLNRSSGSSIYAAEYYDDVFDSSPSSAADVIELAEGETQAEVDLTGDVGGTIGGRVVDTAGDRLRWCDVASFDFDGNRTTRSDHTGRRGGFALRGLVAASHVLGVNCGGDGWLYYAGRHGVLAADPADAKPIAVTMGDLVELPTSLEYGAAALPAVANVEMPELSGELRVGETLTVSGGIWVPEPEGALSYVWKAGGEPIVGAAGTSYTLAPAEIGDVITVEVTANAEDYKSGTATTEPSDPVKAAFLDNTASPTITGDARVGEQLNASTGTWTPIPSSFTYRWFAEGTEIEGATESTFTPTIAEKGDVITVEVTAKATEREDTAETSAPTAPVKPAHIGNAEGPSISGTAKVGLTLTADPGGWNADDLTFNYQWLVAGTEVGDATEETFVVPATALGKTVTVEVTATGADRDPVTLESHPTAPVVEGTLRFAEAPKLVGTPKVGKALTVTAATVSPKAKVTYSWSVNGKKVKSATKSKLKLVKAYKGKKVTVKVVYGAPGYQSKTYTLTSPKIR